MIHNGLTIDQRTQVMMHYRSLSEQFAGMTHDVVVEVMALEVDAIALKHLYAVSNPDSFVDPTKREVQLVYLVDISEKSVEDHDIRAEIELSLRASYLFADEGQARAFAFAALYWSY